MPTSPPTPTNVVVDKNKKVKTKSIFSLNVEELMEIVASNQFPHNVDLKGIETHPKLDLLFKHRNSPKLFAQTLLGDKGVKPTSSTSSAKTYQPTIPASLREKKLELKEKELQLQQAKQLRQTQMWERIQDIDSRLKEMEKKINYIYSLLRENGRKENG